MSADLHTHSNASDGTLSPADLVEAACRAGLSALALTDHDTIAGLAQACAAARSAGLRFLPGIELSAENKRVLHILGLGIDLSSAQWPGLLSELANARCERNVAMLERLNGLGINIAMSELTAQTTGSVSRAHIARCLVERGICADMSEAFSQYLVRGARAYVPCKRLSAAECIEIIHHAGGVAVAAHIFTADFGEFGNCLEFMKGLKKIGIDALECHYHNYTPVQQRLCLDMADELGLAISGGSDFHGQNKPNRLGMTLEGEIPDSVYDNINNLFNKRRIIT